MTLPNLYKNFSGTCLFSSTTFSSTTSTTTVQGWGARRPGLEGLEEQDVPELEGQEEQLDDLELDVLPNTCFTCDLHFLYIENLHSFYSLRRSAEM